MKAKFLHVGNLEKHNKSILGPRFGLGPLPAIYKAVSPHAAYAAGRVWYQLEM